MTGQKSGAALANVKKTNKEKNKVYMHMYCQRATAPLLCRKCVALNSAELDKNKAAKAGGSAREKVAVALSSAGHRLEDTAGRGGGVVECITFMSSPL